MMLSALTLGLATLASTGHAKSTQRYCDPITSICYAGWAGANGVTLGIALPAAQTTPFDTVLQIVSPIRNGWVGFSWGGTMPYVPLTVGWMNSAANTSIYSSRMALGCSEWLDVDGNVVSINANSTAQKFAYGLSNRVPVQPANNQSTFNVHSSFGHYTIDLMQGQNAEFDSLVAANLVDDAPPTSSSAPIPSASISVPPTTMSTTAITSSPPGPIQTVIPASCSGITKLAFPMHTAQGWRATKVAGSLTQPRGLIFDIKGNLLVVQNGLGITAHKVSSNGCLTSSRTIIAQRNLNHGIVLSLDGATLYASSATSVYAWPYDASSMTVTGDSTTIVTGMDSRGHVTRTLSIPPLHPHLLLVSHGSNSNFDYESADPGVGRSCIKVFDTRAVPPGGYSYRTSGQQMGYGLRNEVGLAFDATSSLWGVENSSDELHRTINGSATDIHIDNPADEINFLGNPAMENTQWYGYPTCYTVFAPSAITDKNFEVGDQFVLEPNATFSDETSLPAHSAPLDALFNADFSALYVTMHGSWNRSPPVGFKVIAVPFSSQGDEGFGPVARRNAEKEAWHDLLWNEGAESCSTTRCFRPVGMAVDMWGRVYISSDSGAEGEIVVLGKE
ncbi:iron reductase domain-containing protein [Stemphylium lycopersici]|nr:iron reductase domain-containing protein [Stemphylium lycopersici]